MESSPSVQKTRDLFLACQTVHAMLGHHHHWKPFWTSTEEVLASDTSVSPPFLSAIATESKPIPGMDLCLKHSRRRHLTSFLYLQESAQSPVRGEAMEQAPGFDNRDKKIPKRLNSAGCVLEEAEHGIHQTAWGQAQPWLWDLPHPNSVL